MNEALSTRIRESRDAAAAVDATVGEQNPSQEEGNFGGFEGNSKLPKNFKGHYELQGLITFNGREVLQGHFISWVRKGLQTNEWYRCNDAVVTEVTTADVLKLTGGTNKDMCCVLMYVCKI